MEPLQKEGNKKPNPPSGLWLQLTPSSRSNQTQSSDDAAHQEKQHSVEQNDSTVLTQELIDENSPVQNAVSSSFGSESSRADTSTPNRSRATTRATTPGLERPSPVVKDCVNLVEKKWESTFRTDQEISADGDYGLPILGDYRVSLYVRTVSRKEEIHRIRPVHTRFVEGLARQNIGVEETCNGLEFIFRPSNDEYMWDQDSD